jgi:hypothetical protein
MDMIKLNFEQQMRAEEIQRVQRDYDKIYHQLKNLLGFTESHYLDELLELERRLIQLEKGE